MAKIIIKINEDASTEVSVKGAKGKSCMDLTKPLEERLGKVVKDRKTSEYYQKSSASAKVTG